MKSKKILTILLSLAIMFTFMPSLAFANVQDRGSREIATGTWAADGSYVTVNGHDWAARRILSTAPGATSPSGKIIAQLDDSAYSQSALADVPFVQDAYFLDLTGATLNLADIYTQEGFKDLFTKTNGKITASSVLRNPTFNIKTPEYIYDYANQPKTITGATLTGWNVTVAFPDEYVENSESDQEVTLTAVIESNGATGTYSAPYRIDNTTITKKVKILGELPKVTGLHFYDDEVVAGSDGIATPNDEGAFNIQNRTYTYDGEAHKVVSNSVTGYTVTYATLNKSTGKYEGSSSECPTVTNVGDVKDVEATISWSKTTTTGNTTSTINYKKTDTFRLSVSGAYEAMPGFQFDGNGDIPESWADVAGWASTSYGYTVPAGESYDATAWVDPVGLVQTTPEKAVVANEAALMDFFNDFYTIKVTKKAAYPDYDFLTIEKKADKEFDTATFAALKAKHATLLKNFLGYSDVTLKDLTYAEFKGKVAAVVEKTGKAYVYFQPATSDTEVEFTSAPSSKTYKGSKTTKKGKLKKNQSFTVKAVANNGYAVSYKLINANSKIKINKTSGKITLKKGLAKGTYKIKVKAYVVGHSTDPGWYETQAITIKVKK